MLYKFTLHLLTPWCQWTKSANTIHFLVPTGYPARFSGFMMAWIQRWRKGVKNSSRSLVWGECYH